MKYIIACFFLLTVIVSCRKEIAVGPAVRDMYPEEGQPEGKYLTMDIDGVHYDIKNINRFLYYHVYPNSFSLKFYNNLYYAKEDFSITRIPMTVGRTIIERDHRFQGTMIQNCAGHMWNVESDQTNDSYKIDSNANNFIEVLSFDEQTKEAIGIFQMTLYRDLIGYRAGSSSNLRADTIKITNGKFDVLTGIERIK